MSTVLILGGTAEARALAAELVPLGRRVVSSLAGRVTNPRLPVGEVREGGFGGPAGLAAWMRSEGVDTLVDATHPFAERMSAAAARASAQTGIPLLILRRPGWHEGPDDRWHRVPTLQAAATALSREPERWWAGKGATPKERDGREPEREWTGGGAAPKERDGREPEREWAGRGAAPEEPGGREPGREWTGKGAAPEDRDGREPGLRVFLTTGRRSLPVFAGLPGVWILARSVDPPEPPVPGNVRVLLDRGPYTVEGERALLREHRIGVLVTKDSGGPMTTAKLVAARELGVPVVMVDRPQPPPGVRLVESVGAAVAWVQAG
ncbi:precorrin-6A/cobalt-precorrin-6A reductase [Nonomuraea typhae]|uniref:Precorrin-6A/cobalt-precorrin-6A reductase n=1 Tax=Nonomuraea typhae TaxID=2603600 RepID=A0ABW7YUL6_9ACTN